MSASDGNLSASQHIIMTDRNLRTKIGNWINTSNLELSSPTWVSMTIIVLMSAAFFSIWYLHLPSKIQWPKHLQNTRALLRHVLPTNTEDRRKGAFIVFAGLLCVTAGRAIHLLSPLLIRNVLASIDPKQEQFSWHWILAYVGLVYCLRDLLYFFQWTLSRRLENQLQDRICTVLYHKLMTLSNEFHDKNNSSATWSSVLNSAYTIATFISNVAFGIGPSAIDLILAAISFTSIGGLKLGATMISVLVCYVFVLLKTSELYLADGSSLTKARETKEKHARETIFNWTTVTIFNRLAHEERVYQTNIEKHAKIDADWSNANFASYNAKNFAMTIGVFLMCWLVSREIWEGQRDKADLVMFLYLWSGLIRPVDDILGWNEKIRTFSYEAERLCKLLDETPSVKDKPDAIEYKPKDGTIQFQNVSFRYDGKERDALHDISCTIHGRSRVAIIGQSGGGKSTLLKLILRSYSLSSGTISLDGHDTENLKRHSILGHVGYVPQDVIVFNITVLENVRYPRPQATDEQCKEACQAVSLQHLLDTEVGDRGCNLSGGELQRLAIARVLIQDPEIVLLDEATGHLDPETAAKIQSYIDKWAQHKTLISVVHSFKSVTDTCHVIAVRDGVIVDQGNLQDLLAKKGYVWDLWIKDQPKDFIGSS